MVCNETNYSTEACKNLTTSGQNNDTGIDPIVRICVQSILFLAFGLFAAVGNIIVNIAIWRLASRRLVGHYFIMSLSWSDLFTGVIVAPVSVFELLAGSTVTTNPYWCRFTVFLSLTSVSGTAWNLVCISIDRFIAVHKPLHYDRIVTPKRAFIAIGALWSTVVIWAALPLMGLAPMNVKYARKIRTLCVWVEVLYPTYLTTSSVAALTAVVIVLILQISVYLAARKQARRIRDNASRFDDQMQDRRRSIGARQRKVTRLVGMIVGFFFISYFPWFMMQVWNLVAHTANQVAILIALCLMYLNSAANPWLYALSDRCIRVEMTKCLHCLRPTRKTSTSGVTQAQS